MIAFEYMDRDVLAAKLFRACYRKGAFLIRTGEVVSEYFDKYQFESDPILLAAVVSHVANLLPDETEVLTVPELGGIPLGVALSLYTKLPVAFIRRTLSPYGTRQLVEGVTIKGKKVVLIDDVMATGTQLIESYNTLLSLGARVVGAVCVIDRQKGGHEQLGLRKLQVSSLFKQTELTTAAACCEEQHSEVLET